MAGTSTALAGRAKCALALEHMEVVFKVTELQLTSGSHVTDPVWIE